MSGSDFSNIPGEDDGAMWTARPLDSRSPCWMDNSEYPPKEDSPYWGEKLGKYSSPYIIPGPLASANKYLDKQLHRTSIPNKTWNICRTSLRATTNAWIDYKNVSCLNTNCTHGYMNCYNGPGNISRRIKTPLAETNTAHKGLDSVLQM